MKIFITRTNAYYFKPQKRLYAGVEDHQTPEKGLSFMNKSIKYNEKVSYERKGERNVIFSEINKLYRFFFNFVHLT